MRLTRRSFIGSLALLATAPFVRKPSSAGDLQLALNAVTNMQLDTLQHVMARYLNAYDYKLYQAKLYQAQYEAYRGSGGHLADGVVEKSCHTGLLV